ncbi:uncharacterized protein [Malus domestica]|uniref:uncharacterized protein n=1 Tax=Malus domestica TaxID=3750 RepID=UPI00397660F0
MSNLNKLDFTALEVSGMNCLKWVQDVKLHLTAKNLRPAIEEATNKPVVEAEKATAMIFIRRHIYDALQTEYLAKKDPHQNQLLMNNHQARPTRATIVPEAHYSTNQHPTRQKRRDRGGQKPSQKGQHSQGPSKGGNKAKKRLNLAPKAPNFKNKGKAPKTMNDDMSYRCGSKDHWSRVCRAPKKVVDEYHSRRK